MPFKIEKLVYGGEGLAHHEGETVFIPYVLPGETVEATQTERKKKFVRAHLDRLVVSSPERIKAKCRHFSDCGGCDYQHIPYKAQLEFKETILRETLRRLGRIDWPHPITAHASPQWNYRNRAQWRIRPITSDNATHTNGAIGYFRSASSSLCAVEECPILSSTLSATLASLRSLLAEGTLPSSLREVEAFADNEDRFLLLNLSFVSLRAAEKAVAETLTRRMANVRSILLRNLSGERMELIGPGFLDYRVGDKPLRVGHLSFFQTNRFLVPELVDTVTSAAGIGSLVFDLFAGVGLFSVPLAETFSRVEAVEADPASARDLEVNVASAAKAVLARCDTAEAFLTSWKRKRSGVSPNVAVLDPPRAGVDRSALVALEDIAPERILYVSCDPSTLSRDLAILCTKKYRVAEIHFFDMFPQTYHIETLIRLERVQ
jgi:23S rRNA (uracil1939-C5)-methyltransferase